MKNSPSRNLHRLLNTLAFISAIFKNLQQGKQLKEAVSGAFTGPLPVDALPCLAEHPAASGALRSPRRALAHQAVPPNSRFRKPNGAMLARVQMRTTPPWA